MQPPAPPAAPPAPAPAAPAAPAPPFSGSAASSAGAQLPLARAPPLAGGTSMGAQPAPSPSATLSASRRRGISSLLGCTSGCCACTARMVASSACPRPKLQSFVGAGESLPMPVPPPAPAPVPAPGPRTNPSPPPPPPPPHPHPRDACPGAMPILSLERAIEGAVGVWREVRVLRRRSATDNG